MVIYASIKLDEHDNIITKGIKIDMSSRTKTIKDQFGVDVSGVLVDVEESTERFSDVRLNDGTLLRTKLSVIEAVRTDGKYDDDGNPIYVVKSANVITIVEVSEELKKKVE